MLVFLAQTFFIVLNISKLELNGMQLCTKAELLLVVPQVISRYFLQYIAIILAQDYLGLSTFPPPLMYNEGSKFVREP